MLKKTHTLATLTDDALALRRILLEKIVYDDMLHRAWYTDEAMAQGLLFACKQGQVNMEKPFGASGTGLGCRGRVGGALPACLPVKGWGPELLLACADKSGQCERAAQVWLQGLIGSAKPVGSAACMHILPAIALTPHQICWHLHAT